MTPPPQEAAWPTAHEWSAAVQNPHIAFSDAFLRAASPAVDKLGMPVVSSGNFAYVFKVVNGSSSKAVRCFSRRIPDRQHRYEAISKHLDNRDLPFVVGFDYDANGIRVNGSSYPVLVMEWLNGDALDVYLCQVVTKRDVVAYIAEEWLRLVSQLETAQVAHGDLQHGNVLVCNGQLKLVDLDGMYVPALQGRSAIELGHRAYQHPSRTNAQFDETIDRFSALVVYASLKALAVEPSLWTRFHDENLIFTRQDFLQPRSSPAFKACRALGGEIAPLIDALTLACEGQPGSVPSLSTFATSKVSKLPAWMQPVPQGGLSTTTQTREVSTASTVGEPATPPYAQTIPGTNIPMPSTTPRAAWSPAPASSVRRPATPAQAPPIAPASRGGFMSGFGRVLAVTWLIPALAFFTGSSELIGVSALSALAIALVGGIVRASGSNSPSAAPSPSWTPLPATPPRTTTTSTSQPVVPPSRKLVPVPQAPIPPATKAPSPLPTPLPSRVGGSGNPVVVSRIRSIFHRPSCEWALKMSSRNRQVYPSAVAALNAGYTACKVCRP